MRLKYVSQQQTQNIYSIPFVQRRLNAFDVFCVRWVMPQNSDQQRIVHTGIAAVFSTYDKFSDHYIIVAIGISGMGRQSPGKDESLNQRCFIVGPSSSVLANFETALDQCLCLTGGQAKPTQRTRKVLYPISM